MAGVAVGCGPTKGWTMFTGLNAEICAKAWDTIGPSIKHAFTEGLLDGYKGAIVVLDPANPEGDPLFTARLGDDPGDFPQWATAKARLALRTGYDTTRLRNEFPHLYQPGDIKWPGGVLRDGLAMGFSGVQGEYDQMICEWFASAVRAICRIEFYGPEGEGSQPTPYLGREA